MMKLQVFCKVAALSLMMMGVFADEEGSNRSVDDEDCGGGGDHAVAIGSFLIRCELTCLNLYDLLKEEEDGYSDDYFVTFIKPNTIHKERSQENGESYQYTLNLDVTCLNGEQQDTTTGEDQELCQLFLETCEAACSWAQTCGGGTSTAGGCISYNQQVFAGDPRDDKKNEGQTIEYCITLDELEDDD